ncbi:MAG TPA: SGNH/GDSL hydrolase family protein [Aggregatilinea sp.]|uniref:SGNH/GDSL hydrolase family protein n=1 Tax=Aggregatilinea sp. TaxID=2806333 RepID=UPI002C3C4729|nr:SGNH/GDSL hydrolase family protein [Aggregatilinea sp.]HML23054.1 SGNH/GDSL hydrolase family protein [Aggregatilinea sp.]
MFKKAFYAAGCAALLLIAALAWTMSAGSTPAAAQGDATEEPTLAPVVDPVLGEFDPASVESIDLAEIPILPEISAQARLVYEQGIAAGMNPAVFSKVGDCMTDTPFFLIDIGDGNYDLGEYEDLQPVIDQYTSSDINAFNRKSQAAAGGFNTASIVDSMWANPEFCDSGETPLSCEFRIAQPSVALIMFGTNDVQYLDASQFDFFLRSIVAETIRNGTLPVLSTFPTRPEFPEQTELFNKIVVKVAQDYDMPLINLSRALADLPDEGVDPVDTTHMTTPEDEQVAHFTDEALQSGFSTRNLLTLEALDAVMQAVSADEG